MASRNIVKSNLICSEQIQTSDIWVHSSSWSLKTIFNFETINYETRRVKTSQWLFTAPDFSAKIGGQVSWEFKRKLTGQVISRLHFLTEVLFGISLNLNKAYKQPAKILIKIGQKAKISLFVIKQAQRFIFLKKCTKIHFKRRMNKFKNWYANISKSISINHKTICSPHALHTLSSHPHSLDICRLYTPTCATWKCPSSTTDACWCT